MAKSSRRPDQRRKVLLYSIPVIAVLTVAAFYFVGSASVTPKMDFTVEISIRLERYNGTTTSTISKYIVPPGIGVPGGTWATDKYYQYGIDGHYPVYTDAPSPLVSYPGFSVIHVTSSIERTYYLGDFFDVWGEVIGPNNTLGYTVPPPSVDTRFDSSWHWTMCLSTAFTPELPSPQLALSSGLQITLLYSNYECS